MVELWLYRIFCIIGWCLVGFLIRKRRRLTKSVYGELVCAKEDEDFTIYMTSSSNPEELLKRDYVLMRVLKPPRE